METRLTDTFQFQIEIERCDLMFAYEAMLYQRLLFALIFRT